MLPKKDKLRGTYRVARVQRKGRQLRSPLFILKYLTNNAGRHLFAVVVSKKVDAKAVGRNLIRRRFYEAIRLHKKLLPEDGSFDMLLIVLRPATEASYTQIAEAIKTLFTHLPHGH